MSMELHLVINGKSEIFKDVREDALLVDLLHERGLTATKYSCGIGACGACKVAVRAGADEPGGSAGPWYPLLTCYARARAVHGLELKTTEGLVSDGALHPLQRAFLEDYAFQCGYSTSGFLMAGFCLLERLKQAPAPRAQGSALVHDALSGHVCRCTGYMRYASAIERVLEAEGALVDEAEPAREPHRPVMFRITKQSSNDLAPKILIGGFRDIEINLKRYDRMRFDTLELSASIPIASIVTGEPARDYNLAKFFFLANEAITLDQVTVTPLDSSHQLDDVFAGSPVPVVLAGRMRFAGFQVPVCWEAVITRAQGTKLRVVSRAPCAVPLAAAGFAAPSFAAEFGLILGQSVEITFDLEVELADETPRPVQSGVGQAEW
jgi:aerobic-type carbon monoxide dehydrogenase small subunit (CoxS/CutS family)